MKVVVSYASDLEDIPENASELLNNLTKQLADAKALLTESSVRASNKSIDASLATIDKLRRLLAKIDMRLMDCTSILAGYAKTNADLHLGIDPSELQEERDENAEPPEETND